MVLIAILVIGIYAADAVTRVKREAQITRVEQRADMAYWAAESGFNYARADIIKVPTSGDWETWKPTAAAHKEIACPTIKGTNPVNGKEESYTCTILVYAPDTTERRLPALPQWTLPPQGITPVDSPRLRNASVYVEATSQYDAPTLREPFRAKRTVSGWITKRAVYDGNWTTYKNVVWTSMTAQPTP